MRFAVIENSTVINVISAEQEFIDTLLANNPDKTYINVNAGTVATGDTYDGNSFTKPEEVLEPEVEKLIKVTLNKTTAAPDESIVASVEMVVITDGIETVIPTSGTFFVPVMRTSDNTQAEFLKVDLVEGIGSVTFTIPNKGVYNVDSDKIFPTITDGFTVTKDINLIIY